MYIYILPGNMSYVAYTFFYMCIHVYMYYICIHVYMYVHMYTCIYTYTYGYGVSVRLAFKKGGEAESDESVYM